MLIIEFYDNDYGFLMMYDLINDILIVFEKKIILLFGYFRIIIEFL